MDSQQQWLRRSLIARLFRRLALEATGAALVIGAVVYLVDGPVWAVVPWAVIGAQLFVLARLVGALMWNPVSASYLEHYTSLHLNYRPRPIEDIGDHGRLLQSRDLHPTVSLVATTSDGEPRLDVYQATNQVISAVVGASTGATVFASQLSDGRLLVTSDLLIPPHASLFVNYGAGRSTTALLDGHVKVLHSLAQKGLVPVTAGPEIAVDLAKAEQASYRALGPFLAPFLALEPKPPSRRLQIQVSATEMRRIAIAHRPAPSPASQRHLHSVA